MATKTEIAIGILKANLGKSMEEVLPLIMEQCDLSEKNAIQCYRLRVKADPSLGTLPAPKARGGAKAPKAKVQKMVKVPTPKVLKDKPKVTDKTVEELEDIKNKNLARLKAVHAKYKKGQYAEGRSGKLHTDEEARAEVRNLEDTLDSFKAPKFLNMADVKALV